MPTGVVIGPRAHPVAPFRAATDPGIAAAVRHLGERLGPPAVPA